MTEYGERARMARSTRKGRSAERAERARFETYRKPLPNVDRDSRPQWEGFRQRKFLLWRCKTCGAWYWPKAFCRNHPNEPFASNMQWAEASGRGRVFVFNVHRTAFHPGFANEIPYVYALIELEEGPLFGSNVVGCAPEDVRIGMPVEVVYDDITPEWTLPKFRPSVTR